MKYVVRIELHEPPDPNYVTLHAEMEAEGFERWIWFPGAEMPAKVALPSAEYIIKTMETADEVLLRAKRAAERAHPGEYGVLVTNMVGNPTHFGLRPWVEHAG